MVYTGGTNTKLGGRSQSMTKSNLGLKTRRNTGRIPHGVPEVEERLEKTGDLSILSDSRYLPRDEYFTPQKLPSIKSRPIQMDSIDY